MQGSAQRRSRCLAQPGILMLQRRREPPDLLLEDLRHVQVQGRRRRFGFSRSADFHSSLTKLDDKGSPCRWMSTRASGSNSNQPVTDRGDRTGQYRILPASDRR